MKSGSTYTIGNSKELLLSPVVTSPTQSPFFNFVDEESPSLFYSFFIEVTNGITQKARSSLVESARMVGMLFA
jgi:hypothetical protein